MQISVFGLGYVGCTSAACLAKEGHMIIGDDINPAKVEMINRGQSPIIEKDIDAIIKEAVENGRLSATTDLQKAIHQTDIAFVCVGTPSNHNGSIDLHHIKQVCEQIGEGLQQKQNYFVIVVRSTILPGTIEKELIPILEHYSGKSVGKDFGICMNPEFMREGSSVYDYYNPPKIVIGEYDKKAGDIVEEIYQGINAPVIRTEIKVAEMIKYVDNSFHALKVAFANEVGNICQKLSLDSHKVMDIFCLDTKLNLSSYYLKPGFAFGGSCLPKDLRAINHVAKRLDIETPLLGNILRSNSQQIQNLLNKLMEYKKKRLGFLGLSFKEGTDDMRESPIVEVIETMLGKGFEIYIFDKNVSLSRLIGANKEYIEKEIPHISSLMCSSIEGLIENSDVIIMANKENNVKNIFDMIRDDQVVIDLVRIPMNGRAIKKGNYYGICW